jgi:hypothetical protein
MVVPAMNNLKKLKFVDLKPQFVYGKKQQTTLDDECSKILLRNKIDMFSLLE